MSGVCIDKLSHDCGTRKGLQVFADPDSGEVTGFCFSCGTYVHNPYGEPTTIDKVDLPKPKTEEEIQREIAEVSSYPTVDLPSRKLRAKHLQEFEIKVAMSERDGKTPVATYFPITRDGKVCGYYVKTLGKNPITYSIGDVKGGEPLGWQRARRSGAYKLFITEGKEDAVALEAIFDRYGDEEYHPAIIALPNGTNSIKSSLTPIAREITTMFKEVVYVPDDDEPGRKAVKNVLSILPSAKTVTLPEKDANDCILKGVSKAAYKALSYRSEAPKNTRLVVAGPSLHEDAREPTPYGELTWPWPHMNSIMRGIRLGETIYAGAGVKMGKSGLLDELAAHFIQNDKVKVLVAKPEEANKKSYKRIAGKIAGTIFDDPDVEFDYDAYDEAGEVLKDNLILIDLYQHLGWETLREDIVAAANLGVKVVFIDPITNLTAGMSAAEVNQHLTGVTRDISALALDLNIVVFLFVHLKSPDGQLSPEAREKKYDKGVYYKLGACPHERGGTIYSNQFAGSRAMMQACNLMIGLEGNKDPDLPDVVKNTRWLTILEDREFNNSESIELYRNPYTTLYKEVVE